MYQQDAQHTGRSPHAGPQRVRLLRVYDTAHPDNRRADPFINTANIESSAAIAPDGTIYLATFAGTLYALRDPGNGDRLQLAWRFQPPGRGSVHSTPAIGRDGTLYAMFGTTGQSPSTSLYALKAPAGGLEPQVAWSVELGDGRATSSPIIAGDGTIYAAAGAGKLSAVSPEGSVRWSAQTGPLSKSSPALGPGGTVYLPSIDGKLYAVEPPAAGATLGSVRWAFDFGAHPGQSPMVVAKAPPAGADGIGSGASPTVAPDGMVYVGANNSNFYAIAPDGQLKWQFEAQREVAGIWSTAALSADNSTLYFAANKGGLYALDRDSGKLRWRYEIYGPIYSSPTLDSRGVLYTGSTLGHLFAVDSATGKLVFDADAATDENLPDYGLPVPGPGIWTAPALRPDGSLVVANRAGRVMVFGPA
jgi:outer membrane protein assembly factor BamB